MTDCDVDFSKWLEDDADAEGEGSQDYDARLGEVTRSALELGLLRADDLLRASVKWAEQVRALRVDDLDDDLNA